MRNWNYHHADILELKFEDFMSRYDETVRSMFAFLGFSGGEMEAALEMASRHDINRKTNRELAQIKHVTSRQTTRWRDYFTSLHKEEFRKEFGSILVDLGYEASNDW
jgi:hypothetical protein